MVHSDPPKKEERADHVEMWQDKMRRLRAHGGEHNLVPMYKINAVRVLMTDTAKEHFALWEAGRDHTDVAKSLEELLSRVKDYARKRKLDALVHKSAQHGSGLMHAGSIHEKRTKGKIGEML